MNDLGVFITGIFIGMSLTMFSLAFFINHFHAGERKWDNEQ